MPNSLSRCLLAIPIAALSVAPGQVSAQSIEESLGGLISENAQGYVGPLVNGFGYAIASGLVDRAEPLGRFSFDVGVRVSAAVPPAEAESFEAVLPESVQYGPFLFSDPYRVQGGGDGTTPTAVGEGLGIVLEPDGAYRTALISAAEDPDDYTLPFPEGLEIPAVPFAILHGSLGIGFGTEVSLRFIPEVEVNEEIGSVKAVGFAVQHNLTQWLPVIPVTVSAVLGRQSFNVGTYFDASSTQYGLVAGGGFGPLSVYGSGMSRSASVDVTYEVENPDGDPGLPPDGTEISFANDLESGVVFAVGARLSLLILNIAAQYSLDDYSTFTLKVGFGL